ncbi:MAG: fructosamine kinase [Fluviicola sp. XM-24bin1]|nr:MAG: fructosamine kinase [Fluviicola sp. XM-24bin1]
MQTPLEKVLNKNVQILSRIPLSGGDINAVFKVKTDKGIFCVKQNNRNRFPEMLKKEAKGLKALAENSKFHIPNVIGNYEDDSSQHLVLDFIESGQKSPSFWKDFGTHLAQMHQQTSDQFGWSEDNYIGSLHQSNKQHSNWADFYTEERILPQIQMAFNAKLIDAQLVESAERLCSKLPDLFPKEAPALLHGDLWSGNFMVDAKGNPVLIDPAVYYGHREMDLGMMQLFGGFSNELFEIYHEVFPLEKSWQDRIQLTQLYPILVHVNLFGGGYVRSAASIIHQYC